MTYIIFFIIINLMFVLFGLISKEKRKADLQAIYDLHLENVELRIELKKSIRREMEYEFKTLTNLEKDEMAIYRFKVLRNSIENRLFGKDFYKKTEGEVK